MIVMIVADKDAVNFGQLFYFTRWFQVSFFSNKTYNPVIKHGVNNDAGIRIDRKQDSGMSKPICFNFVAIGQKLFLRYSVQNICVFLFVQEINHTFFELELCSKLKLIKGAIVDGWFDNWLESQIKLSIFPILLFVVLVYFEWFWLRLKSFYFSRIIIDGFFNLAMIKLSEVIMNVFIVLHVKICI